MFHCVYNFIKPVFEPLLLSSLILKCSSKVGLLQLDFAILVAIQRCFCLYRLLQLIVSDRTLQRQDFQTIFYLSIITFLFLQPFLEQKGYRAEFVGLTICNLTMNELQINYCLIFFKEPDDKVFDRNKKLNLVSQILVILHLFEIFRIRYFIFRFLLLYPKKNSIFIHFLLVYR